MGAQLASPQPVEHGDGDDAEVDNEATSENVLVVDTRKTGDTSPSEIAEIGGVEPAAGGSMDEPERLINKEVVA